MSAVPARMKFAQHGAGGAASALTLAECAVPQPCPNEVLIRVAYAGVNRPDVSQRQGIYPAPAGASPIIGLEVSGEVVALGKGVNDWAVGDLVCALTNGGGYAQYVCVPSGQVLPVPRGLSLREAAALPENCFTVWSNVFERGRLVPGESFLVHGGSSGIGLIALQLAHARGATAYATVGSDAKARACERFGATAIRYREEDFVERIAQHTGQQGVDVILDMVGGDYVARNLACLALDGRLVQISFRKGSTVTADWSPITKKRLTYTGSNLRPRTDAEKASIAQALHREVWPLFESDRMTVVIDSVFGLDAATDAHALMEASTHIGKILLRVGS